jgi:hypothetical protein
MRQPSSVSNGVGSFLKKKGETLYAILWNPSSKPVTSQLAVLGATGSRRVTNMLDRSRLGTKSEDQLAHGITIFLAPLEVTALSLEQAERL